MKIRIQVFILMIFIIISSCKTSSLLKQAIPSSTESTSIGLVIQFENSRDTSEVLHAFLEALTQCGWKPMQDIFKSDIYLEENFQLLYNADSVFIKNQKSLHHLPQLLVVKLKYVVKNDHQSGKNSIGMTCNARWISTGSYESLHEFYYAEKINNPDNTIGLNQLQAFLGTQIYMRLCLDIQSFIPKKN